MTQTMRAFQFVAWQKPGELREVPIPEPGPGQVLVMVGGAGACHSDLHLMEMPPGTRQFQLPFTLGHENAGWVEKLGPGIKACAIGDPVIVYGPWGYMGADEGLLSGGQAITRVKDMTRGQGAELVLDMVGIDPRLQRRPRCPACSAT